MKYNIEYTLIIPHLSYTVFVNLFQFSLLEN